jgi:hypothetical protein
LHQALDANWADVGNARGREPIRGFGVTFICSLRRGCALDDHHLSHYLVYVAR